MDAVSEQKLIDTLVFQHQTLRADIAAVSVRAASPGKVGAELIHTGLSKFKEDLFQHLKLENETFYVDFLVKKRQANEDVEQVNNFIEQMDVIGKVVTMFLNKYATVESIMNSPRGEFVRRLSEVTDMLNVRMETEERSVYQSYLQMHPSSSNIICP